MELEEEEKQRAPLVLMKDIYPDDSSGEELDMIKHMDHLGGGSYMTYNYVTVIPVEYPRPDSSPLSGSLRSGDERDMVIDRHSPFPAPTPRHQPTPTHCYSTPPSRDESWRMPRERQHSVTKQEVCVYLLSKVCLCVEVDSAVLATAEDIMNLITQDDVEMNLPSIVSSLFQLWMTSPLLEVQLKPQHRPCRIRQQWPELLKKYTFSSQKQITTDEPVLTFQRNVFFDKSEEAKITEIKVLELLYAEAKGNILDGRYPCETEDCLVLGAIQARLELGPFESQKHTPEFFRTRIREFLPEHACRSHWFLLGLGAKNGPEKRLVDHYRNTPTNIKNYKLMRKYLEFCWALPYYGSAFFQGQIERPVTGIAALMNHYDLPVLVGVNREGVHVIDPSEPVVLMSLKYKNFSWEYACPVQPQNSSCLPCLFLQFKYPGQSVSSVIQIFSKQAFLMDTLITSIVDELKQRPSWSEDETDHTNLLTHSDDEFHMPLTARKIKEEHGLSRKLKKLSIATFSADGRCLVSQGSLEFQPE